MLKFVALKLKRIQVALAWSGMSSPKNDQYIHNIMERTRIEVKVDNAPPFSQRPVVWNGNYPFIPGTGGIKHYLYAVEFYKMFPTKETFHKAFPTRDYKYVAFPGGYDDRESEPK